MDQDEFFLHTTNVQKHRWSSMDTGLPTECGPAQLVARNKFALQGRMICPLVDYFSLKVILPTDLITGGLF